MGTNQNYVARRRKEDLSFMVVRFLKAFDLFQDIDVAYQRCLAERIEPAQFQLFERIKDLEEKFVYDIKEKAHFLFRFEPRHEERRYAGLEEVLSGTDRTNTKRKRVKEIVTELRKSLMNKSIDSYIGTGFHMFMILRESVYQLERYALQFESEHDRLDRIDVLIEKYDYELDDEDIHELGHIRELDSLYQTIEEDTRGLSQIALERCRGLFQETATILRHYILESAANEVLVLNLLRERELLEKVYGPGAAEEILAIMFAHTDIAGSSGINKAFNFVKKHCSNTDALPEES